MAKYKVLRPIEHDQKLYLPEADKIEFDRGPNAPGMVYPATSVLEEADGSKSFRSVGHGQKIPIDDSGEITLSETAAAFFQDGQIALLKAKAEKAGKKQG
jgi:hypothetical protein